MTNIYKYVIIVIEKTSILTGACNMSKKSIDTQFDNIQFTGSQQSVLKRSVYGHLGMTLCETVDQILKILRKSSAKYNVLLSDSCFNLIYTIQKCGGNDISDKIMSGTVFMAKVHDIADYYATYGRFPEVLVITDINDSGIYLSAFVDKLCDAILYDLSLRDIAVDRHNLRSAMGYNISIIAMTSMLYGFSGNLLTTFAFDMMLHSGYIPRQHDSCRTDMLFLVLCNANNNIFASGPVPTMYVKDIKFITGSLFAAGFMHKHRIGCVIRDFYVRRVNNNGIVAIYGVEIRYVKVLKQYMIIPHVVLSGIYSEYCDNMLASLFESGSIDSIPIEFKAALLRFMLSCAILQMLRKSADTSCSLDLDRLRCYFNNVIPVDAVVTSMSHFLDWGAFEKCLRQACIVSHVSTSCAGSFESDLIKKSREFETALYKRRLAGYLSVNFVQIPWDLLSWLSGISSEDDITSAICDIFEAVDYGYITLDVSFDEKRLLYVFNHSVTEVAQIADSAKNMTSKLGAVAGAIEKDCNSNVNEIVKSLNNITGVDPGLIRSFAEYTQYLYSMGLRLHYWDLNWLLCIKVDDSFRDAHRDVSEENLFMLAQIAHNVSEREFYKNYRKAHPSSW